MNEAQRELCEQLQAEIEEEIKERDRLFRRKVIWLCLSLLLIPAFLYRHHIAYKMKHFIVKPTETTNRIINIYERPTLDIIDTHLTRVARSDDPFSDDTNSEYRLVNLFNFQSEEFINILNDKNEVAFKLLPMATFSMSGRVLAVNSLYSSNMDTFDRTAQVDMGLIWGKCAADSAWLDRNFEFKSKKYLNGRVLTTTIKDRDKFENKCRINDYEVQHFHIVPASNNILGILLKQKKFTPIRIDGLLVDIFSPKEHLKGSLNIDDINQESRSGGSCKVILITSVQVGNKIYK